MIPQIGNTSGNEDALYRELTAILQCLRDTGKVTLHRIGDCHGPATIGTAVYEGQRFIRELGGQSTEIQFRRDVAGPAAAFELP